MAAKITASNLCFQPSFSFYTDQSKAQSYFKLIHRHGRWVTFCSLLITVAQLQGPCRASSVTPEQQRMTEHGRPHLFLGRREKAGRDSGMEHRSNESLIDQLSGQPHSAAEIKTALCMLLYSQGKVCACTCVHMHVCMRGYVFSPADLSGQISLFSVGKKCLQLLSGSQGFVLSQFSNQVAEFDRNAMYRV